MLEISVVRSGILIKEFNMDSYKKEIKLVTTEC